jgi:hypothetical protein
MPRDCSFTGTEQVLDDLGRYTHRVAISNHHLVSIDDEKVTFTYKARCNENRSRQMTLNGDEFIRHFLLHVLPPRFVNIRYFGFLFHRDKHSNIILIGALMAVKAVMTASVLKTRNKSCCASPALTSSAARIAAGDR